MTNQAVSHKRHRFPPKVIAHVVWLYFRFPLSLRLVEELLLERGIVVSYETVRHWAMRFGPSYARRLRRKTPSPRDIWHLDEVVITIAGQQHWLWRAVDQDGYVLDEIVQTRRDTKAAKRLLKRLLKKQGSPPRRLITDKLGSCAAARRQIIPAIVLLAPLMFPIAKDLGIHPVHYAMVVVVAMNIGLFAPPLGIGHYIACSIGKVDPDAAMKTVWFYLGALVLGLVALLPNAGLLPYTLVGSGSHSLRL